MAYTELPTSGTDTPSAAFSWSRRSSMAPSVHHGAVPGAVHGGGGGGGGGSRRFLYALLAAALLAVGLVAVLAMRPVAPCEVGGAPGATVAGGIPVDAAYAAAAGPSAASRGYAARDYAARDNGPPYGADEAAGGLLPGHGRSVLDGPPPPKNPPGLKIAVLTMYVRGEDPRGPSNRTRIVNYSDKTADIADIALANFQAYCDFHGYDLLVVDHSLDASRPLVWSKLVAMIRYLPDYDWLLYLDGDALFANYSVTIEERTRPPSGCNCTGLVPVPTPRAAAGEPAAGVDGATPPSPPEPEFFVAAHAINDTLNSGVLLMKNTPHVMNLLVSLYRNHSRTWNGLQDNRAVTNLLGTFRTAAPPFVCRLFGPWAHWLQSSVYTTDPKLPANFQPGDWIVHFAGPCFPWCRVAAQLVALCAAYPHLPECRTALTRAGWVPLSSYGKILHVNN